MTDTTNSGTRAAQEVTRAERIEKALTFRQGGASYRSIAREMGVCAATAFSYVQEGLDLYREQARERAGVLVELENQRLDALQAAHWGGAMRGNKPAADTVLRVMERRARLNGLDAPQKIAPTDPSGENPYLSASDDELRAMAVKIAAGAVVTEREEK